MVVEYSDISRSLDQNAASLRVQTELLTLILYKTEVI